MGHIHLLEQPEHSSLDGSPGAEPSYMSHGCNLVAWVDEANLTLAFSSFRNYCMGFLEPRQITDVFCLCGIL